MLFLVEKVVMLKDPAIYMIKLPNKFKIKFSSDFLKPQLQFSVFNILISCINISFKHTCCHWCVHNTN